MNPNLTRFLTAQENTYEQALSEIKSGRKRSHWMWYIFPQFKGLGRSETANYYAIQTLDEAMDYLNHPILGYRLRQITLALLALDESNAVRVLGRPDDLKLRSSMTLFCSLDSLDKGLFQDVLQKFFAGELDAHTLKLIQA